MLRLHDARTGLAGPPPGGPGLRVQVLDGGGLRAPVVADLLRRVAERGGRRGVRVVSVPSPASDAWADHGIAPFEVADAPLPDADVYVGGSGGPEGAGLWLDVPPETAGGVPSDDALAVRLAILEVPYREPLELTGARAARAAERLDRWRGQVAEWATSPGRPMNRAYATEAEAALADDLDAPGALAVLDRLAADPEVPPGAKLETFIHVDLLLALGLVSAIGSA
ncbi:hypothetical protein [Actinomadura chibensis]|uniref:Cysteinyl-tRNA synthetase n=1 Tax=Actinomadura chibensis TaxID=392828 RepID=A0A5D0NQT2_9ACTN|nr:hypothetical protein [Actinomadura chibensis]TYB46615.1 hypothetical protein FXF69_15475 [Actinomadura chibensis]